MPNHRKPTPRYDSIGEREDFQLHLFAVIVITLIAATLISCIVSDVYTARSFDAIIAQTSAQLSTQLRHG